MKRVLFLVPIALLAAACSTTDHRLTIMPPDVSVPVSASAYYSSPSGNVVDPDHYVVLDHFSFTKEYTGPVGVKDYASVVDFAPDIAPLVRDKKADAVVNMRIIPKTYNSGNASAVGATKIAGSMLVGFGCMFGVMGLAMGSDSDDVSGPMALAFGGLGCLNLGASFVMKQSGKTTWTVAFEGDLVKRQ